jgi:hypothetical protein
MDTLRDIEQQVNAIKKEDGSIYLDAVFAHINRAEFYYNQGKIDNDFFNDVIYRSNQAYEGALKESYKVLADKSDDEVVRKSPNDIERYFETNNIFRDRVLQLFSNYRKEWRNKSTHDYKLFFDESEAFIALTSVTSFVHLLLKQIQEKVTYLTQQKILAEESNKADKAKSIVIAHDISPVNKLVDIVSEFAKQYSRQIFNLQEDRGVREVEIIGLFHAYTESIGHDIEIIREPRFNIGSNALRPDFLIKIDGEPIILEFKRAKQASRISQNSIYQVLAYMQAAGTSKGIIYNANFDHVNPEIIIENVSNNLNGFEYEIIMVTS